MRSDRLLCNWFAADGLSSAVLASRRASGARILAACCWCPRPLPRAKLSLVSVPFPRDRGERDDGGRIAQSGVSRDAAVKKQQHGC